METAIIAATAAIFTAVATGFFAWRAAKSSADSNREIGITPPQAAINDGFKILINRLREDRDEARQEAQVVQSELRTQIRKLVDANHRLERRVGTLERLLTANRISFEPN